MSSVISVLELPPSAPGAGNPSAASDARADCACLCQAMGRPCVMPPFVNSGWLMWFSWTGLLYLWLPPWEGHESINLQGASQSLGHQQQAQSATLNSSGFWCHNWVLFPFGTRFGKAMWSKWQDLCSHSIGIPALHDNQQINSDTGEAA